MAQNLPVALFPIRISYQLAYFQQKLLLQELAPALLQIT